MLIRIIISVFLTVILISCKGRETKQENVLVRFGDRYLTSEEIESMIPDDILPQDSAALYNALMESWIRDVVLTDFAEEKLQDISTIERMVKDYRNSLIVQEYLTRMRELKTPNVDEKKIKDYYNAHQRELKLEIPLVKGIFLKISSDAAGKYEIESLMSSADPKKIDKLEQNWLDRAIEYNYFRDKWIDWETVAGMIPHRFGNPDEFLKENNFFETEYGDCTYYLQITDYLPSGEEQPYEYAKSWITGLLTQGELAEYERSLVNSLIEKALKENKLEVKGVNPLMRKKEIFNR